MKAIIAILILCLSFACQTKSNQNNITTNKDSLAIMAMLDQQIHSWNKADIDGFMQGYWHSPELKFISKKGTRFDYDSVCANYKRHYDSKTKMGQLSFHHLRVYPLAVSPKTYQVTGEWAITSQINSGGYFSLLIQEKDNAWKIVVDHTW